uniref:Ribosomal protein S3 n=1 Tax=Amicula sp. isolate GU52X-4 cfCalB7 TaxID=3003489 RepID=A0A9E9C5T0_9STRA|nr:ribosomal protein S3 [Amicula sp. isolate GU52X-4 cfCalB7]
MAQQTNPNIFRLGKTKEWKVQYFENFSKELSLFIFKNLEIKNFLKKFLKNNGLLLENYKLYSSEKNLYIFISYYLTLNTIIYINKINKTQKIKLLKKKYLYIKKNSNFNQFKKIKTAFLVIYQKYLILKQKTIKQIQKLSINYKKKKNSIKKLFKNYIRYKNNIEKKLNFIFVTNQIKKIKRLIHLNYYKKYLLSKKYKNIKNIQINLFFKKFVKILNKFINKKLNIFLTFVQLNRNIKQELTKKTIHKLKKILVKLRKYKQNTFFKENINIFFKALRQKNPTKLLSKFLAIELGKLKKHNLFLYFVKTTIKNLKLFSKLKGIKIKIKGRLNGVPRAKYKIIQTGNIPILTLAANIDYSETIAYTANGTIGVKIWAYNK